MFVLGQALYTYKKFIILLIMSYQPRLFTPELIKKEKVSRDAYSFYFARPESFDFSPGQYIKMTLDIKNPDERGVSHFFSIASSPTEKEHLMVTTRIIQSSFKKTLAKINIGDIVQMNGPFGGFILDETYNPAVFLTGGIGITPFRSMAFYAHDTNLNIEITLLASFSTLQDLVFYEELKQISVENFKFIPTITHPEQIEDWTGETGRIDDAMIKKYVEDPMLPTYYIAGPKSMVDAMENLVLSMGVPAGQIKKENFPGY